MMGRMSRVKKLILPVAGLGKRLQPFTLKTPKNLIPVAGKPLVEYALEDAAENGISEVVFVMSPQHRAEFERYAQGAKKRFPKFTFHFRFQDRPFGNGHAVLQAADLIGSEPVAVRYPDDVFSGTSTVLGSLIRCFGKYGNTVVALERIPLGDVSRYGVVAAEEEVEKRVWKVSKVVEKPTPEEAPSNVIMVGAYVIRREVVDHLLRLAATMPEKDDALLLTDGLIAELHQGKPIYGLEFEGTRLDCGTIEGLAKAESFLNLPHSLS